jgi:hypothetical protein
MYSWAQGTRANGLREGHERSADFQYWSNAVAILSSIYENAALRQPTSLYLSVRYVT